MEANTLMQPLVVNVRGSNLEIGRQHAEGALHLRPEVDQWVEAALVKRSPNDPVAQERLGEVTAAWERLTPGTLDQIAGMAEVYDVPAHGLLTAVLETYLSSRDHEPGPPDGCTALAVSGGGHPMLAKNRDNDRRFLNMQTVLRAQPESGHAWLALSTAGAPGVHSSGVNELGLCVADTHVPSSDVGPGVPRFSSMMHLLEQCATVAEAVEHVLGTRQMGLGTLTLVDARGDVAVVECAYSGSRVLPDTAGVGAERAVVATNHFVSPGLSSSLLVSEAGTPGASSRGRWARARQTLSRWAEEEPGVSADLRELAASHVDEDGTNPASLCQHGSSLKAETISTAIYDSIDRRLDLCIGNPCTATFSSVWLTDPSPAAE